MLFTVFAFNGPALLAGTLQGRELSVDPDFRKKRAAENLSGAVCAGSSGRNRWCLAVNDEKKYAQFFSLKGRKVVPTKRIRLLPSSKGDEKTAEIDAEGVAYEDGFVYVAGSHGLSRDTNKFRKSQFLVFRFPVNPKTGRPAFKISDKAVASEIERSAALREIIKGSKWIGPFAEQPLSENGANIEGMAVVDGRMYFGFRGPSIDRHAFVLQLPVRSLFAKAGANPTVHRLRLGKGLGIRDMASVGGGLLILSGHVNERAVAPGIHFWDLATGKLETLAKLPIVADAKAETILLLEEKNAGTKASYRVLIFYDGIRNGRPTKFSFSR